MHVLKPYVVSSRQAGADRSIQDADGYTAYQKAAINGHDEAVLSNYRAFRWCLDDNSICSDLAQALFLSG